MDWLFDTDAVSELVRPRPAARYLEWLATVPVDAQVTCAIVVGELLAGARRIAGGAVYERFYRQEVLPVLRVVDLGEEVAEIYADLRCVLEQSGRRLQDNDLWIAACAIRHDCELVTGNIRHFERLEPQGLRLCRVLEEARRG